METLNERAKRDNQLMKLLRTNEVSHIICTTDKGNLTLTLKKDGTAKDYRYVLDAVPVGDKENQEILAIFDGVLYKR